MKLTELKQIYTQAAEKMLHEPDYWNSFLQYAGKMYAYDFTTLVSMYAQNSEYTQMASYEAWNKMNLQIRRGEKSIPALMNNYYGMSHMFDISQLKTMPKVSNWNIGENERNEFDKRFVHANYRYIEQGMMNSSDIIYAMIIEQMNSISFENEDLKNVLIDNGEHIFQDVHYMVSYRCNAKDAENSVSELNNSLNLDEFTAYGHYIMKFGRTILNNCKNVVYEMRKEQLNEREARRANRDRLYREERNPVRKREGGSGRELHSETRQVRTSGKELLAGEQGNSTSNTDSKRNNDEDHARDRGQSQSDDGTTAERNAGEGPSEESTGYNGELQAQAEDTRSGRGNRAEGSSVQIKLDFDNLKLNAKAEKGVDDVTTPFLLHSQTDERHNYHYEESDSFYEGGLKTKFKNNVAAIKLLKDIEKEKRLATSEEQVIPDGKI